MTVELIRYLVYNNNYGALAYLYRGLKRVRDKGAPVDEIQYQMIKNHLFSRFPEWLINLPLDSKHFIFDHSDVVSIAYWQKSVLCMIEGLVKASLGEILEFKYDNRNRCLDIKFERVKGTLKPFEVAFYCDHMYIYCDSVLPEGNVYIPTIEYFPTPGEIYVSELTEGSGAVYSAIEALEIVAELMGDKDHFEKFFQDGNFISSDKVNLGY